MADSFCTRRPRNRPQPCALLGYHPLFRHPSSVSGQLRLLRPPSIFPQAAMVCMTAAGTGTPANVDSAPAVGSGLFGSASESLSESARWSV